MIFNLLQKYYSARGYYLYLLPVSKESQELPKGILMQNGEVFQVLEALKATEGLNGVIVEVGCYKGGLSEAICKNKGEREFFIFDTFEGIKDAIAGCCLENGAYKADESEVRDRLSRFPDTSIHKGYFPDSATPIQGRRIAFANIDVDTYKSTKGCLQFFLPRLVVGGVLISHDYQDSEVRKAIEESITKEFRVIRTSSSQIMFIKLKEMEQYEPR